MEILIISRKNALKNKLQKILKEESFSLHISKDVESALHHIKKKIPALIMADGLDSDVRNCEICNHITNIPVINICRITETQMINQTFTSKADDYLQYPFIDSEVLRKIKTSINYYDLKNNAMSSDSFSSEWLEQMRTISNDGLFSWNILTGESAFDSNYYTMAGYEPDEFPPLYKEWEKRLHPDDMPKAQIQGNTYISGNLPDRDDDFRFLRKDGTWMWIRAKIKFVQKDLNGKVIKIIGTHTDITKEKEAEGVVLQLQNYLTSIINSMPTALIGVSSDLTISQWNTSAEKLTLIESTSVMDKKLLDVYPQFKPVTKEIFQCIESSEIQHLRKKLKGTEAENQFWDITIYPIHNKDIPGAVLLIENVSDKIRIDELLVQSEKMLSVGGLAAGMAHELNNPLAGILQSVYVLNNRLYKKIDTPAGIKAAEKAGISREEIKLFMKDRNVPELFKSILDSGQQMAEIIRNMLSFSRGETSSKSLHSPEKLLNDSVKLSSTDYDLKKQYDFKKITIKKEYNREVPEIFCVGSKIQQVIMNLLRNAAQAMSMARTSSPKIILRTSFIKNTNNVVIEIEDNGPGVEENIRKRIFEPFFTTKQEDAGTGLGLSISYFIITKDHKGEMFLESDFGKGAKFIIRLPVKAVLDER